MSPLTITSYEAILLLVLFLVLVFVNVCLDIEELVATASSSL